MPSYEIRLAKRSELPFLREIEIEAARRFVGTNLVDHLLNESFDQEKLALLIESEQVWVACSKAENQLVGFAIGSTRGGIAYLEEMDVLPDHGRRGLGSRLIAAVSDWAARRGFDALVLSTFAEIAWNAPFYERLGFRIIPAESWTEDMQQIRAEEVAHNLPTDKRVFMRLDLKSRT